MVWRAVNIRMPGVVAKVNLALSQLPRFAGLPFFFFNDTATPEIYTLSLHDALPIWDGPGPGAPLPAFAPAPARWPPKIGRHTSELQSRVDLVCRLLLEKKKKHY